MKGDQGDDSFKGAINNQFRPNENDDTNEKNNKDKGFDPVTNRYGASCQKAEIPGRVSRPRF